jgi:peptidoglycan-N-acetylglucosamine deacetylase
MKNHIFKLICCSILVSFFNIAEAQINPEIAKSSIKVEMLFPGGKPKALILSFDDGPTADRRLIKLMNQYDLKGTFHLNSNKFGEANYVTKAEIKTLYAGHEVSVHSANHPNLPDIKKIDVISELLEDRKALEKLVGYPVRGMAYPFGNYNDEVIDVVKDLNIEYARTVEDSYHFAIPKNFLKWEPTVHQFCSAYFKPNQPEVDQKEMARFNQVITDFIKADTLALLDIWGHSWENGNGSKWDDVESYFKQLAHRDDVFYTTHINLVDYIKAYRNLKFSVDKDVVENPSSQNVFIKINKKVYEIPAGGRMVLAD